ncbi:cytochrome c biogenesis protein CcdA [Bosea sp. BE271]|uniref:cytochrome c biogenesis CcdA family protein n=1 Tax=Bosea TaxID=85413 RepID=UPI002859BB93|nr:MULTISPECIES: cytochrome c biogenesis protein CcdA [Bosea]MDR6830777.1 cytochrome c biogenesis protein CcdA [Bosea robiniae]MDR6895434.1 cytochrome c biogenesis protein CcdA [Bosea sp. BE109]MDR7138830.1 cytochrome c biogenesis protein CcdA [Bosea sp. BE168]MDR7175531.1 cytochrome c biogenesis protein CcdA [Bosea sp. BE271]
MASLLLALIAGILSVLSPCVLPLLPIVLGTAVSEHKLGPAALAAGLALSFAVIGLFVATVGFAIGLDAGLFRNVGAILMAGLGVLLLVPSLQVRVAAAGGPLGNWAESRFGGFSSSGLQGQFGVGLLLGAVWSPCVGPTLGAASLLAARGENLPMVTGTMLMFGIGAGLPLVALGSLSRSRLIAARARLAGAGQGAKMVLGSLLLGLSLLILTGLDKQLEAVLVAVSPGWLTRLTTTF